MQKGAEISECGTYRYSLWRIWDESLPTVLFIGLNPSTADGDKDDPTLRRCIVFARDWGYGGLYMANLFAFRSPHPAVMKKSQAPIGPKNDETLLRLAQGAGIVVACWGTNGKHRDRDRRVRLMLPGLHCIRKTESGHPEHPLYLPGELRPVPFV